MNWKDWTQTIANGVLSGLLGGLTAWGSGASTRSAVGAGATAVIANLAGLYQTVRRTGD